MKALIISDIHQDFNHENEIIWNPDVDFDLIILAGDIGNYTDFVSEKIKEIISKCKKPVIMVAGNHDFWDCNFENPKDFGQKYTIEQSQNIYSSVNPNFLNRRILEIDNERILGCTLWYDCPGKQEWSDHDHILDYWMIDHEAKCDIEFLNDNLRENDIVVTHMLPSFDVVSSRFIGDRDNRFYVNSVHGLIHQRKPKIWISGHSHERMVRTIHNTVYIRNPFGHNNEEHKYTHLIVDLKNPHEYGSIWECSTEQSIKRRNI